MPENERILIAPLNWGLGHATRCIPLIRQELIKGNKVVIASDGEALTLLKKEFPALDFEELPGYGIRYAKKSFFMPFVLGSQIPKIWKTIRQEKQKTDKIITKYRITKIMSDNRYGVRHQNIKSVFITHQLRIFSGILTPLSTRIQKKLLSKFDEIWVPDFAGKPNLSGKLSHEITYKKPVKYIGPLSRLKKKKLPVERDILVLLSGPEPQRTLLEKKLLNILHTTGYSVLLVQGKPGKKQEYRNKGKIKIVNFLLSDELEGILQSSGFIISRPGYTSVMDFYKLDIRPIYIPTPGQTEQEYLSKHLHKTYGINFIPQKKLDKKLIIKVKEIL